MPRYVALLRAINVGGHVVTMERLRAEFEALALAKVETFIASGNVIFESGAKPETLEKKIEARLGKALGYEVDTFLRTDSEVAAAAAYRAFPAAAIAKARAYVVGFCREPLTAAQRKLLDGLQSDDDEFRVNGREVYWKALTGQGRSKFSNAVFERVLRTRATWRGMNTLVRLAAKYPPAGAR